MRWSRAIGGLVVAGLGLLVAAAGWRLAIEDWRTAADPDVLDLPVRPARTTLMGIAKTGPPPWPAGNQLLLSADGGRPDGRWLLVLNMFAENLGEWARQVGAETVRALRVGDRHCLDIDPRVPRDWFLTRPADPAAEPALRARLGDAYADWFHPAEPPPAPGRAGGK
jgi:hypothetical protein